MTHHAILLFLLDLFWLNLNWIGEMPADGMPFYSGTIVETLFPAGLQSWAIQFGSHTGTIGNCGAVATRLVIILICLVAV